MEEMDEDFKAKLKAYGELVKKTAYQRQKRKMKIERMIEKEKQEKKESNKVRKMTVSFRASEQDGGISLQDGWSNAPKGSVMRIGDKVIATK